MILRLSFKTDLFSAVTQRTACPHLPGACQEFSVTLQSWKTGNGRQCELRRIVLFVPMHYL